MIRRRRLLGSLAVLGVLTLALAAFWLSRTPPVRPPYVAPRGEQTFFAAPAGERRRLTIEAATDVSFMRGFIKAYQRLHPRVAVLYVDMLSSALLTHALRDCATPDAAPDLFLSISTDHLIELANRGCAAALPAPVGDRVGARSQWRREVVAFSFEPAVFVYNRRLIPRARVPLGHLGLMDAMRADPAAWQGRIGTYDIEQSGTGYNYASADARQKATYGRLIESFGRSRVRTYCCSNEMVDAVASGQISFAYNIQLSYAYAGQRAGQPIGVVLPDDYQAIQARSVMVTRGSRNPVDAAAFVDTLLSPAGQRIARNLIAPPPGRPTTGSLDQTGGSSLPVLNASVLSLRDEARRARFIVEWRRAVRPPEAMPPPRP